MELGAHAEIRRWPVEPVELGRGVQRQRPVEPMERTAQVRRRRRRPVERRQRQVDGRRQQVEPVERRARARAQIRQPVEPVELDPDHRQVEPVELGAHRAPVVVQRQPGVRQIELEQISRRV